jgi:hypothetical protein
MSLTINMNNPSYADKPESRTESGHSRTIKPGNHNNNMAQIPGSRLAAAQKKSMKMIIDQFHSDLALDQSLKDRAVHQEELQQQIVDHHKKIQEIDDTITSYKEQFGITEETPKENYPEEYKQLVSGLQAQKAVYQRDLDPSNPDNLYRQERREQYMISDIKLERLKDDPMYDTQKDAAAVISNALDSSKRSFINEARKLIDEQFETMKEEAQADKSEEEKQEEELLTADTKKEKDQTEIRQFIEEQHIIDEDALGIAVDQRL